MSDRQWETQCEGTMLRLGILCPPAIGHLNPMCALARELERRGHEVVFFTFADAAAPLQSAGFKYKIVGESEFPLGSFKTYFDRLGRLTGLAALSFTISMARSAMQAMFRHAPTHIRNTGINGLLVDQVGSAAGSTIADFCGLPFVNVCNALPVNLDDSVPPFFTYWQYRRGVLARLRNSLGNFLLDRLLLRPPFNSAQAQRRTWNLPP